MPQANEVLTVPLSEPPTGIFGDVSRATRQMDLAGLVQSRLEGLAAMLLMMKNDDDLPRYVQNALFAVEVAVEDAAALLSVMPLGDCG